MKVPRNAARVSWLIRSRRKLRRTRGLSWLAERVKATIVTEIEIPATATVAVAIVSSMLRAASWVEKMNSGTLTSSQLSTSGRARPTIRPATIARAAGNPNVARTASTIATARSLEARIGPRPEDIAQTVLQPLAVMWAMT